MQLVVLAMELAKWFLFFLKAFLLIILYLEKQIHAELYSCLKVFFSVFGKSFDKN